jgi:hypothetical protein
MFKKVHEGLICAIFFWTHEKIIHSVLMIQVELFSYLKLNNQKFRKLKLNMPSEKLIRAYSSCIDDTVTLVEVVQTRSDFTVRVLGEPEKSFATEREAFSYAENKADEFQPPGR